MNYHFVTGTSQGIGLAIARELLQRDSDNHVTGFARSRELTHPNYHHQTMDLSDPAVLAAFQFPQLTDAGRLVLINNAGTLGRIDYLGRLDATALASGFTLNLSAPAVLLNQFIAAYQNVPAQKLVINLSSGAATKPYDGWGPYCSAKAGLEMLTLVADQEQTLSHPAHPISFKSISPGPVQTAMQAQIRETDSAAFSNVERFRDLSASGALPSAEEIAVRFADLIEDPDSHPGVVHRFA